MRGKGRERKIKGGERNGVREKKGRETRVGEWKREREREGKKRGKERKRKGRREKEKIK